MPEPGVVNVVEGRGRHSGWKAHQDKPLLADHRCALEYITYGGDPARLRDIGKAVWPQSAHAAMDGCEVAASSSWSKMTQRMRRLAQDVLEQQRADWKYEAIRLLVQAHGQPGVCGQILPYWLTRGTVEAGPAPHDGGYAQADRELEMVFRDLADTWRRETGALSSITVKSMHPAYQSIVGMGPKAVPLILRELQRKPDHWFWALTFITGEDPVPREDAGDIRKMTEAWLELGRQRGWV